MIRPSYRLRHASLVPRRWGVLAPGTSGNVSKAMLENVLVPSMARMADGELEVPEGGSPPMAFEDFHSVKPLLQSGEIGEGIVIDSEDQEISGDRAELLPSAQADSRSSYSWFSFFTLHYYQSYFDVTSAEVAHRVLAGTVPLKYNLIDALRPNPDLYGPFWLCMTLIFTTAISGNVALLFQKSEGWEFHFHEVTVLGTAIYLYTWLVPVGLWGVLWWRGNRDRYTLLELLSIYGYCIAVFIPVTVLWAVNSEILRWILLAVGAGSSGTVLVLSLWKPLRTDSIKLAGTLLAVVFVMHAGLAILFKFYYFNSALAPETSIALAINSSSS